MFYNKIEKSTEIFCHVGTMFYLCIANGRTTVQRYEKRMKIGNYTKNQRDMETKATNEKSNSLDNITLAEAIKKQ